MSDDSGEPLLNRCDYCGKEFTEGTCVDTDFCSVECQEKFGDEIIAPILMDFLKED